MNIVFSPQAWEDYQHWQTEDRKTLRRVNALIDAICRDPYAGIGKPERLRYRIDAWSRRIDGQHRLVYRVEGQDLLILQARYHY
ncbi:Txe/YoeB family addiction module toxin [Demequina sp. SYSU T00192]|uniref:Endoribonuclease YoeB n=1 Tax=Demequina litoralis TaxID=3051660 RepID=A0ABT8G9J1_9MICO|nr:Txe/YoeB family addiction module toxin [Demequina sp. SYSU T00192]MDN4475813.1 Txe/YoeB family addiction module toxin [Demequina sp. SYSU T00192]